MGSLQEIFRGKEMNDLMLSFLTQTVLLGLSTWPVCNPNVYLLRLKQQRLKRVHWLT